MNKQDTENRKDNWDKIEIVGKVLIPVVIGVGGFWLNWSIGDRQTQTERAGLAIGILAEPVLEENVGVEDPLRRWAADVLDQDFAFSEEERRLLLTGERSLPAIVSFTPPVPDVPFPETSFQRLPDATDFDLEEAIREAFERVLQAQEGAAGVPDF